MVLNGNDRGQIGVLIAVGGRKGMVEMDRGKPFLTIELKRLASILAE